MSNQDPKIQEVLRRDQNENQDQVPVLSDHVYMVYMYCHAVLDSLHMSIFTAPQTPYNPKDVIESAYGLKQDLKGIRNSFLEVIGSPLQKLVIAFIQDELNPFLVKWHGVYFHDRELLYPTEASQDIAHISDDDIKQFFMVDVNILRDRTTLLEKRVGEQLEELLGGLKNEATN